MFSRWIWGQKDAEIQFDDLVRLDLSNPSTLSTWEKPVMKLIHNMTQLCLDNISISYLPPAVGLLRNLEVLLLDHNYLTDFPITLGLCQKLTVLSFKGNYFQNHIPGVVLKLKNLKECTHNIQCPNYHSPSVQNIPPEGPEFTIHNPLSLQTLCTGVVFIKHKDYRKHKNLDLVLCRNLRNLGSDIGACDICGRLIPLRKIKYQSRVVLLSYFGKECVPFRLRACSVLCQQKLANPPHSLEMNAQVLREKMYERQRMQIHALRRGPMEPKGKERVFFEEYLEELDLSGLRIPSDVLFFSEIWSLHNLKKLSLNSTGIDRLPPQIGKLQKLEHLSLKQNSLRDLPATLGLCRNLTVLYLESNCFTHFPSVILRLKNLKDLYPAITSIGYEISTKPTVQTVDLAHVKQPASIVHSPASRKRLCRAAALIDSTCRLNQRVLGLKEWEEVLSLLVQCKYNLAICDRCGRELSHGYFPVNILHDNNAGLLKISFQLRACSENCQQELASHFVKHTMALVNMKVFERCTGRVHGWKPSDPFDDDLIHAEEMISAQVKFESIVELDVSAVGIPDDLQLHLKFWNMHNLKKLCLDCTGIRRLSFSIGKLSKLEVLSLRRNYLQELPITLKFCQKLTTLRLEGNKFRSIPAVVLHLINLKDIIDGPMSEKPSEPEITITDPTPFWMTAATFTSVASLESLCQRAVFVHNVDYWKSGVIGTVQCEALDRLASSCTLCHACGTLFPSPASDESTHHKQYIYSTLGSYPQLSDVPFRLDACSARCA